ncbi:putative HTH-type transcriptional regulator YwnA [compost metagenome]
MAISSRFIVSVHILTLLAQSQGKPVTSEWLAGSAHTNPAVIRKLLVMLAKAGLTTSQLGAGGGALLAQPASAITLLDVYRAVSEGELFALHNEPPSQACPIGRNIQTAMVGTISRAQQALETELAGQTIASVLDDVLACETQRKG